MRVVVLDFQVLSMVQFLGFLRLQGWSFHVCITVEGLDPLPGCLVLSVRIESQCS